MDYLDDLRSRLLGKTIRAIEPVEDALEGGVATFVMADGTAFRLCATDLGAWVEDTVAPGGLYTDFDSLIRDYSNYEYRHDSECEWGPPLVEVVDNRLRVVAPDGHALEADIGKLNEWEQRVCRHPQGPTCMGQACSRGAPFWRQYFQWGDVPAELRLG